MKRIIIPTIVLLFILSTIARSTTYFYPSSTGVSTPTPTPSGQPTPPPLVNPQNPISFGADPTGASDSTSAFQSAANAGDVDVPSGTFKINTGVVSVNLGSRNMRCETGAVLTQPISVNNQRMFGVNGNGSIFNCHFRGANYNHTTPSCNAYPNDFIFLSGNSSTCNGYRIIGNDFNGTAGFTGAVDVYANTSQQPPCNNFTVSFNTFEYCSYYAIQLTSGTNGSLAHNTGLDCSGMVEADNTGQQNTGNVADSNHFTFVNGAGVSHGGACNGSTYFGCGVSASGSAYNYSGNTCSNNLIDGPYPSFLWENAVGGAGNNAHYVGNVCTGGCTIR